MNLTFLFISIGLGVISLICARSFVLYMKKEDLGREEKVVLPIAIVFFTAFGICGCFSISEQNILHHISDIFSNDSAPIYAIVVAVAFVFSIVLSGAYKTAGRISIFTGLSLGVAIGMSIFYTYFIGLAVVSITFPLSYIVTRYIQSVKNNI